MNISKSEIALNGVRQLLISRFASKTVTLVFLIAFVRLLKHEELSLLPLYYAASGASVLLFSFGIPATLVREIPRLRVQDPDKMLQMLFTGFTFVLAGILFTSILGLIFQSYVTAVFFEQIESELTYQLIATGMAVGGWHILLSFILKSLQEYKDLAIYNASYDLIHRAMGLVGFLISGIDGLLIGFIMGGLICNFWFTSKYSSMVFASKKIISLSNLIRFSWPFYIEGYLHYFRNNGDILVVGSLLGPHALAVFYVAKRLYDLLMLIIRSIEDVISPSLSELLGHSLSSAVNGYSKVDFISPLVLIPIGFFAVGCSFFFVDVVGGDKYLEQAYIPTAAFCLVAVIEGLYGIQGRAIFVLGRPADRLALVATQAAIYFPLLFLLVPQAGMIGAPLAQFVSFTLGLIYAKRVLSRIVSSDMKNILIWKIIIASSIALVILVVLQLYYYSIFIAPVYFIAATILFVLIISIFVSESEIESLSSTLPGSLRSYIDTYSKLRRRVF